jgi:glycosyltransferase involved in cell wall biosynthesis
MNKEELLLSILIPMYNAEKVIGNCIESLLNQGIPTKLFEIIIINDGSIDNSILEVEKYYSKTNNIKLHSQKNHGNAITRNKLFNLARGKYIYCLDADDYLIPNTLLIILNLAIENNLDILGFKSKITKRLNDKTTLPPSVIKNELEIITGPEFLGKDMAPRIEIWWYIIKKEFLQSTNIQFSQNQLADVLFTLTLFSLAKKVSILPIEMHRYFQSPDSIMRTNTVVKNIRLAKSMRAMVGDLASFINSLQEKSFPFKEILLKNLNKQRDLFAFSVIFKTVRIGTKKDTLKSILNELKKIEAYPIKNTVGMKPFSPKYYFLNFIINKHKILLLMASFYRYKNGIHL